MPSRRVKALEAERGLLDLCKFASVWPVTPVFSQFIAVNAKVWDKLDPFAGRIDEGGGAVNAGNGPGCGTDGNFLHPWIRGSKCQLIIPEQPEVKKAMELMRPVVKEWLDTAGALRQGGPAGCWSTCQRSLGRFYYRDGEIRKIRTRKRI
jgi:hypothetical protein